MKYKILAIMGRSGAGKDTFFQCTCRHIDKFNPIILTTTRPMRDYEVDGEDYYFVTDYEFCHDLINAKFLTVTEYNKWFYGVDLCSLSTVKPNIGVFSPAAIEAMLKNPMLDVKVVWITANAKTRLMRSLEREEEPNCAEICRRYLADLEDFANIPFDALIIDNENNSDFDLFNEAEVREWIGLEDKSN
jgi:guanylate kinase